MERPRTRAAAQAHIDHIRKLQGIDTELNASSNLVDTLEQSLKLIADGLYQYPTRFLLELLQNADDCSYDDPIPTMNIIYWNGRLRVEYNEVGFGMRDVEAICQVSSTKGLSTNQTGEKGIGFKSVFKIADVVWVHSGSYSFQFDATRKLGMITPQWVTFPADARPGFTSILLQLRSDCRPEVLAEDIKSLSSKSLLFLRRIRQMNITIHAQDGETWKTTLSRKDERYPRDFPFTTTTLSQGDMRRVYWVYQRKIKLSHSEPKRAHCTESVVTLAFPIYTPGKGDNNSLDPVTVTVIEDQDVHATLPVRNYGFKFVINADFLLVANREDIVSSSDWNKVLQNSITDVFQAAIEQLNTKGLRYTWPKYVSTLKFLHSFQDVENGMKNMLLHGKFLESISEAPVATLFARYVPPDLRGENNMPLTLSPKTMSKYLSLRYADSDWNCLEQLGVRMLSNSEFLEDLAILVTDKAFIEQESEEWHTQVATILTHLCKNDEHKAVIKNLPLIPLQDGRWVLVSVGNIFFESEGPSIPDGLGVLFLHARAAENATRKLLFQALGVQRLSVSNIRDLILTAHSKTDASEMPTQDLIIKHAVFLFRILWSSHGTPPPFWVVSELGSYLRADQAYLDTTTDHYFAQYFEEFRDRFCFLHPKYHEAVRSEDKESWLSWLRKELKVQNTAQLLPRFQDLAVEKCSGVPPSRNDLIRHTVFLFRTSWIRKGYLIAFGSRQIPKSTSEPERSTMTIEGVTLADISTNSDKISHFYTKIIPMDFERMNFRHIMTTWPSREFLTLLREEWNTYEPYLGLEDRRDRGNAKLKISAASAILRERLRSAMVSCIDGSSRALCETFTVSILPDARYQAILSSQLLLDIPDPHDAGWEFLEIFGVTTKNDVKVYLRYLSLERNRGSDASKDLVFWLYGKIQEKADENWKDVSEAFKSDYIFIPKSRTNMKPVWAKENECVWDGTNVLQKFHVLKGLYSQYESLFTRVLTHTHMDFDVLVSELESVTTSTPLNLIIELFKEVGARYLSLLSNNIDRLRSRKIFPVDEGNARSGFDDLCSGLDKSEWYIADRPQYRNSFRGVVSLLSFSPWDILTMMPLIKALGFESRLLSKRANPIMGNSRNVRQDPEKTELFRAKSKFIAGGSYLPFEIATQLADICGIGEQADLVYFAFSHPSLSYIEQYLDQQYIPIESNDENGAGNNEEVRQIVPPSRFDEVPGSQTTTPEPEVVPEDMGTITHSYSPLDNEQEVLRPGYASLSDHYANTSMLLRPTQDLTSETNKYLQLLPVLAHPRIVGRPHITFIQEPQELPREDFSENAPSGNIFPGRIHISDSGSCNITVATNPDTRNDLDVAFAGELLVSKLLEQHLGMAYHPELHWTSHLRMRADHTSLTQPTNNTASFTLQNVPELTNFLLRSSLQEAMWWWLGCPVYHIQVQTTVGGHESPFLMSADNFERARKYRITEPWPVRPDDIFILVRVADLYTRPTAFFYIDSYRMYVSGYMRVQPEGGFFAIEIQPAKPQLKLGDFSHYESATLRGRKHQLMEPIIRFSLFSELNRHFASGLPGRYIETYMYRPLTDGHIRLLELFPGETLDDLRDTLHHVPLTHTRPYQAISYAWGFAVRPFVLKTREGVIGITASLCLGLRRLRQKKSPTLIWADAICINQNDVKEKNEQVRLMPEIFKTAERVSVWTGPEANGSSTAIDCLWRMAMSVQVGYIQMLRV
ncbi:hypothetical protein F5Y08DRAFT_338421 [Xylaria arbuscula]|nr:hypothetical protein F5Y08DRAFT_338421 [Xylaria arbuscula]